MKGDVVSFFYFFEVNSMFFFYNGLEFKKYNNSIRKIVNLLFFSFGWILK